MSHFSINRNKFIDAVVCLLLGSLVACGGGVSQSPAPGCDPREAPEVLTAAVQNMGPESLQNYAVAVPVDQTALDFRAVAQDGSDLAVWDATTHRPVPAWLESFDPAAGKALLWVKLSLLGPRASASLLLTAGVVPGCSAAAFSGYAVFPFFSDVSDVSNWQTANQLSVNDKIVTGPLTISRRNVIESDGSYNGFPGVAQASNGDFVLAYKKGGGHVNSELVIVRRSVDGGATWSPEVVYFDSSAPDPGLIRTPLGDLLMAFGKANQSGAVLGAYGRSTDNGLTWGAFTFFQDPPIDTLLVTLSLNVGSTMYAAGYGLYPDGTGDTPTMWSSSDDGFNWVELSRLRQAGEPGANETAIAKTGDNALFAMMRADDSLNTYGRYSNDMGLSWEPLISYTTQVGVLQFPQLIQAGPALILMGRDTTPIPGILPAYTKGYPRQLVAFVSYDGGQTFGYGTVLDSYTGLQIDGGCMLLPSGEVFVAYYADSYNQGLPDIKSLTLSVAPPATVPATSIHVTGQLTPGIATHALDLSLPRYALEFRFRSNPIPSGSQFSVLLRGEASGSALNMVNWELPSTHAADPTSDSGIISNQQFVPVMNAFSYGQPYRLRTVVDETEGTQQASVLDTFGSLISATAPQPLAQGSLSHATSIEIGNNSTLRATDTLLDFVYIRPAAQVEPLVTVTRIH